MAVMAPKKNTVGTANAWMDNQRTVKIGYVISDFFVVMFKIRLFFIYKDSLLKLKVHKHIMVIYVKTWNQH